MTEQEETPLGRIGFVDVERDLGEWVDGPADSHTLHMLVATAAAKAQAWAPKPLPAGTDEDPIPYNYTFAQIMLTKHLWARKQAGDGEGFGADGYMIQTYPLVREAYDAIRPRRNVLAGLL